MHNINSLELSRVFILRSPDSQETEIDQIIRSLKHKFPVFDYRNISEIYHNEYLPNQITLKNGVEFHCRMGNKKIEEFSKFFSLEEQIKLYGNDPLKDVPHEIKKQISVLLYLYLNKVCIFNNHNLMTTLNQMNDNDSQKEMFNKCIQKLNMIYLQPTNLKTNHLMSVYQYFNKFIFFNNKEVKCFSTKADFLEYLE
tara:strand:+ start:3372 stop:3962 length:591 start_codon:yes stop_codon:yes gene_type:complete